MIFLSFCDDVDRLESQISPKGKNSQDITNSNRMMTSTNKSGLKDKISFKGQDFRKISSTFLNFTKISSCFSSISRIKSGSIRSFCLISIDFSKSLIPHLRSSLALSNSLVYSDLRKRTFLAKIHSSFSYSNEIFFF